MDIAGRIHQLCKEKNIASIYELSKITKVAQSTIQSILSGHSPKTDTVERLCSGLGITMAEFFKDDPITDDQIKQQLGDDLFPRLIEGIKKMDLPQEIKDKALSNFDSLSDKQKQDLLSQLVKSVRVEGNQINYSIDSDLTDVINKYKSLPAEHRKAVDLIIDSLHTKKGEHNERTN